MQVISNLIANAIYAMPAGGTLTISVEDMKDLDLPNGCGVVLTVKDSGVGISDEQLPRIFDAFFTDTGRDRDRNRAVCCETVVEGHGGKICVKAAPTQPPTAPNVYSPATRKSPAWEPEIGQRFFD